MKSKDIQDALTNVSDKYIEEAATYKRSSRAMKVWRGIAIAACCVIAASVTLVIAALVSSEHGRSADGGLVISETAAADHNGAGYNSFGSSKGTAVFDSEPAGGSSMELSEEAQAYYESAEEWEDELTGSVVNDSQSSDFSRAESSDKIKIIYTADIGMQSTEFDACIDDITKLVNDYGAYFENKNVTDASGNYRSGYFSIRVPKEHFENFINALEGSGTITFLNQNAEDVSDRYYDVQSRLDTAKTKLKRLQELLAQAEDMEDIITIESAISETEWYIDSYQGTLNDFDSQVNYSTVTISLREVYKVDTTSPAPLSFGERISKSFTEGIQDFGESMGDLLIWFAESWTWILFLLAIHAVIFLIVFLIVRSAMRRRRRNG